MKITLRAISKFQDIIGEREKEVEFDGSTVSDLMGHLRRARGFNPEKHRNLKILCNGHVCRDMDSEITEGDTVSLLPIVAGG